MLYLLYDCDICNYIVLYVCIVPHTFISYQRIWHYIIFIIFLSVLPNIYRSNILYISRVVVFFGRKICPEAPTRLERSYCPGIPYGNFTEHPINLKLGVRWFHSKSGGFWELFWRILVRMIDFLIFLMVDTFAVPSWYPIHYSLLKHAEFLMALAREREGRQVPFAPGMLIVLVMKPAHVERFSQLISYRSLDHKAGQFNMLRKDLRNYDWQRIYTFQNKEFAFKSSETMTGTSLQRPQKKYNTLPEIRNNANLYIAMRGNIQKRDMISILILTPRLGFNFLKIKRKQWLDGKQERPDIIRHPSTYHFFALLLRVDSMCCHVTWLYYFPHLRVMAFPNVACEDGFLMIQRLSIDCPGGPATTLSNIWDDVWWSDICDDLRCPLSTRNRPVLCPRGTFRQAH